MMKIPASFPHGMYAPVTSDTKLSFICIRITNHDHVIMIMILVIIIVKNKNNNNNNNNNNVVIMISLRHTNLPVKALKRVQLCIAGSATTTSHPLVESLEPRCLRSRKCDRARRIEARTPGALRVSTVL